MQRNKGDFAKEAGIFADILRGISETDNDIENIGYGYFGTLTYNEANTLPYSITMYGFKPNMRTDPFYICAISKAPEKTITRLSLRAIGLQSRSEPTLIFFLNPDGDIKIFGDCPMCEDENPGGIISSANIDYFPVKPAYSCNNLEVYPFAPTNPGEILEFVDVVDYSLDMGDKETIYVAACYLNYLPVFSGKAFTQVNDGGPPPIPPGAEH